MFYIRFAPDPGYGFKPTDVIRQRGVLRPGSKKPTIEEIAVGEVFACEWDLGKKAGFFKRTSKKAFDAYVASAKKVKEAEAEIEALRLELDLPDLSGE